MSSRVRLEEIAKFETKDAAPPALFETLMGSINPFTQFIIREMQTEIEGTKQWELEESIFRKSSGEVRRENLFRTSSEMFVIYKYTNDPLMKVKSEKYT